ncbi:hypothetical protein Ddye_000646 [Dipteronia dyeriana]|uniref:PGG domain-containing protein n=1 Tax=Dipteronia dyeriana TaxID=168575 RepID=A0AAD9XMV2_9ROSI|nr:hypothetical protein Ddye_000646 [Dipteronia dyeriana]
MERRLLEASLTGDVQNLHQLLRENPSTLHTVSLASSGNPLHVASAYGHIDFLKEITRLRPDFANELNEEGFSPMHMASANGFLEIVRELLKVDRKLCRLQGRENKTPLHLAVIKGRVDVVSEILSACGECLEDVTVQRDTAIHLAIKNYQFEVIRVMVDWIREMEKEYVLNMKDDHGNTALHHATWRKQRQVIEILLGHGGIGSRLMEVNAINQTGLTALDLILIFPSEAGDREIEEILRNAGAMRKGDVTLSPSPTPEEPYCQTFVNSPITPETHTLRSNNLVDYFKFKNGRDSPGETRNALLVIAVLVSTATFQVGVNPPGGVWQDNYIPERSNSSSSKGHNAGISIWGSMDAIAFGLFMFFNSVGFTLSLHMINMLTIKFPLQFELQICMAAMFATYGIAVASIAPDSLRLLVILVTSILPSIVPIIARCVREHSKRLGKVVVNLIHRGNQQQH